MTEFAHDDFFTLENGKRQNYMKIGIYADEFVIQHQNFSFDPTPGAGYAQNIEMEIIYEEPTKRRRTELDNSIQIMPNELYHEKFRMENSVSVDLIRNFMDGCLSFFALNAGHDEILWYETGYWSIKEGKKQFMGIGINALEDAIQKTSGDEISFCLANRDSVIIIHGTLRDNIESPITNIDAYSTNAFLPFAEVADIYRNGIRKLHDAMSIKAEFILESSLHFRRSLRCSFLPHLEAFVMMESYPILAVIKNPMRRNMRALPPVDFIIVSTGGEYLKDDAVSSKKEFRLRVDQWKFENTSVFQFFLREIPKMGNRWWLKKGSKGILLDL